MVKLHDYQEYCKNRIIRQRAIGLFMDCGTGKTLTTLSALNELQLPHHVLIIAPKTIAKSTWTDEIKKWGFNLRTISLVVDKKGRDLTKKKRHALYSEIENNPPSIYIISRDVLTDLIENTPIWYFPTVVIDEIQGFKNHASVRFKALKKIRPHIWKLIGLTGTPQPNGLMDLWAPMYLIDEGASLGKNITKYRNTYFNPNPHILVNGYPVKWDPKPGAENFIHQVIKPWVVSVKNTAIKLPPLIEKNTYVEMSDFEMKDYNKFKREKVFDITSIEGDIDTIIAQNAATLAGKLHQLASGFLYKDRELWESPKIPEYYSIHKRKLDALEHIINTSSGNILILYHYTADLINIKEKLTQLGFKEGMTQPNFQVFDKSGLMQQQWNNKEINIMLLQPQSAGHGINIQHGGYTLIWYSIPTSLEMYQQANARLYRQGQTHTTFIHNIITKDTIDEKFLANLERKASEQESLKDAVLLTLKT